MVYVHLCNATLMQHLHATAVQCEVTLSVLIPRENAIRLMMSLFAYFGKKLLHVIIGS